MPFSLDHVVIAVADLEQAVADYRRLGFNVYPGGTHHGGASHNALVIFADGSYFELIAYLKDVPDVRWWQVLSQAGEGLVDFALSPSNTIKDLEVARARGLDLIGPIDGGRIRPDGVRLDWQIVRPVTNDLPFWCGDVTPRVLRVPDGDMRLHPNGVQGIASIGIAVRDVDISATRYASLVGQTVARDDNTARLTLDQITIELTGGTDAAVHIERRGEGPVSLILRGPSHAALDLTLSHCASMSVAP